MDAPREGLMRSAPFELVRADADGDGLTLEGYAAVFNTPTRIDSWEGEFDEVIAPGAFRKTLRERTPVLMFNHGQHPLIGDMPLGTIQKAREDSQGLHIVARLSDNWLVQPVRDAIADGGVSGMSFRFGVVRDEWEDRPKNVRLRTLREVRMPELGPVVFPAYPTTSVGVRANEVAGMLSNPDFRAELSRALLIGTSDDAARQGTSDEAAVDEPAEGHSASVRTRTQRRALLATRGIQ